MEITVELAGAAPRTVRLPEDGTAADLVEPLPVSIHEVSVLVDGRPLPADARVPDNATTVRVVRLLNGG